MNNLSQINTNAKEAYLAYQSEKMLALYQTADKTERNAIIKQIDSFLSIISRDEKIFWLKFRRKLETINESAILFPLGKIFLTMGATEALEESNQEASEFLEMHKSGNWGIVGKEDAEENDL
jgi:hypothetical protein